MSSLFIRTNTSQLTDVLIEDIGVLIDISVTGNEFSTQYELNLCRFSSDLLALSTDDAYGADQSTLLLSSTDNGTPYTTAQAATVLESLGSPGTQSWFGGWS
jgi:hypothetical protein